MKTSIKTHDVVSEVPEYVTVALLAKKTSNHAGLMVMVYGELLSRLLTRLVTDGAAAALSVVHLPVLG